MPLLMALLLIFQLFDADVDTLSAFATLSFRY